jgi:iron complex outermembrane receptor protein
MLVFAFLLWYGYVLAQEQPTQAESPTQPEQPAASQPPGQPAGVTKLAPVIVTATRGTTPLTEVPAAVSVVEQNDIQLGQPTVGLDESLNRVPGVFSQNSFNFAQDQRISIRGFGTRAAFGVREIRLVVDGLPETSPDGQTELDNVDLGAARRIEVLRGPVSSLYGNASGGVISILTEDGPARPFAETRLMGGSFGLQKYQAKTGGQLGKLNFLFNTSYFSLNGYRGHSRAQNVLFTGKLRYTIDERSDLTTLLSFTDSPLAEDAGALTRAQVEQNRRQARDINQTLAASETVTQGRLGFVYRNQFWPGHEITVTQYSLFRQFGNKLPIFPRAGGGIVVFDRFGIGGGVKYAYDTPIAGLRNRFMLGVDTQYQIDNRRRFNNDNGKRGTLRFHQDEEVTSVGPFVRDEFFLRENLQLSAGLRYDSVRFSVDDRFRSDGNQSGARTLDQLSPMGGILYSPLPSLHVYANVSTAFQVPTTTELANPNEGGGFNPGLDPQKAINYEVGARGTVWERLEYDAALFWIVLDNELIQFEGASGRTFFRNAGRSERQGAELHLDLPLTERLIWTVAYTYLDATFDRYLTPAGHFNNNDEPGIPPHQLFTELFYAHPSGFYGALNLLFVDDFFANDANTEHNDAYTVLNLRMGYEMHLGHARVSPFVGLNNISDENYNGLVRLNALGRRFFEPAPDFNVYGGVVMAYEF